MKRLLPFLPSAILVLALITSFLAIPGASATHSSTDAHGGAGTDAGTGAEASGMHGHSGK